MNRKAIISGAVLLAALPQALGQVIDDFSTGAYSVIVNSGSPAAEAVRIGSMLGGERDALLLHTGGPQSVTAIVDGGQVQFFNADSQTSGTLILQYDGLDGEVEDGTLSNGALLNANLSGANAFIYNFRFVNTGINPTLMVTTTVTTSSGSFTDSLTVPSSGVASISHSFADFAGADFSDVRRLDFTFTGGPAADFTLMDISTSPIPGPAAALAFAVGLVGRKRRSR